MGKKEEKAMTNIRSFRELKVWMRSMDAAMKIFELTKQFPAEERFSMTAQVRRSSRSVAANIAEAWRKRRYFAAFVSKLNDAEGEAAETQTHIELARRCSFVSNEAAAAVDGDYDEILAMLTSMAANPDQWTIRP
jgi:four helix bundle protein